MRKLMLAGTAAAVLLAATPAMADERGAFVGGTAGGWTGATIGFFLGGPVGAVIGGWTGAATGAAIGASVLDDNVRFGTGASVDVDYDLDVGVIVDDDVRLRGIEGEDRYGYFRANGNIYVVDLDSREIVEVRLG